MKIASLLLIAAISVCGQAQEKPAQDKSPGQIRRDAPTIFEAWEANSQREHQADLLLLAARRVPAGRRAQRHVLHERFHRVDLAAINFEGFPNDERVARNARGAGAEIHTKKHDAQVFIDGRHASK